MNAESIGNQTRLWYRKCSGFCTQSICSLSSIDKLQADFACRLTVPRTPETTDLTHQKITATNAHMVFFKIIYVDYVSLVRSIKYHLNCGLNCNVTACEKLRLSIPKSV
jgi:hypothetical protein